MDNPEVRFPKLSAHLIQRRDKLIDRNVERIATHYILQRACAFFGIIAFIIAVVTYFTWDFHIFLPCISAVFFSIFFLAHSNLRVKSLIAEANEAELAVDLLFWELAHEQEIQA